MILVTGAAGLSGQAVLKEFAQHEVPVRALVRDVSRANTLRELPGIDVIDGDMMQPLSLGRALDGVDRALMISTADASLVEAQCTFVDAAAAAGVKHVVKFSGAESNIGFKQQNFRHTRNHRQIERYLEASRLAWTHLRPSQFMQVYLRETRSIVADGVLALPAGDIRLAPVDVDDIAKAAFRLLTTDGHEGKIYPMTGPQALRMTEVAALISDAIGRPVQYVSVSPEQQRETMLAAGVPRDFADAVLDQAYGRLRHPEAQVLLETHKELDIEPTTFGEFIRRHKHLFN
jgi:uncharacterized protein YbjT (DUF2867 family)